MDKGLLLVISAPSGGGKGTILKELFAQDENLRLSVSATTRSPRPGEEHGKQYYFLSRKEFEELIHEGKMLEHAEYVGNYYGTPREPVEAWMEKGHDVVVLTRKAVLAEDSQVVHFYDTIRLNALCAPEPAL